MLHAILYLKDLGVLVDDSYQFRSHTGNIARFVNGLTSNIISCILYTLADFILDTVLSHIRQLLECRSNCDVAGAGSSSGEYVAMIYN